MDETLPTSAEADAQSIKVEHAVPEDAEAIMNLKRDAWISAYSNEEHGVTVDDIRRKFTDDDIREGTENWQKGITGETESGDRRTFVVRVDGRVVGFTSPYIENGHRRIGQLYVLPDFQGQGIGSKLLSEALSWHGPDQDVYLQVLSYNDNAINLYERFGFEKTGKKFPEEFDKKQGIKLLPEIEMVRRAIE